MIKEPSKRAVASTIVAAAIVLEATKRTMGDSVVDEEKRTKAVLNATLKTFADRSQKPC